MWQQQVWRTLPPLELQVCLFSYGEKLNYYLVNIVNIKILSLNFVSKNDIVPL